MKPLRLLHVEDQEDDVLLVERDLRKNGWQVEWVRVETADSLRAALRQPWDIVLCDYSMPGFGALEALEVLRASERADTPFIVVSGSIGEEAAIEVLRRGASDFINKETLSRLSPAIERGELSDTEVRRENREAQRALAEALASREELIALAGHEFRNPLAALQITLDSLQRSGRAPEHVQALSRQAGRLRDLVTRFVDIAALESGSFELRTSDVDLAILAAREARRLSADGDRIRVDAPGPVRVHGDLGRLTMVVSSVLDNALKFGGRDPVEMRVRPDGEGGLIEVRDHGPGVEEQDRAAIFRPFGKRVSSRHYGGFGLSLWLSRTVLERHGGTIDVLPAAGGGALFQVRVPARPVNRSGPGSSGEAAPPPLASG